ncbi:MAG: class I SAM-dependent methyltransferase [Candidatus Promineifilaceae bacterium]
MMIDDDVVQKLLTINRGFYDQFASEFAESRQQPQPGFHRLGGMLPKPCRSLLDVGCGNGPLGRFLLREGFIQAYTGVDSSSELLDIAKQTVAGDFWLRELSEAGCLTDLGKYDALCCLATLQHVPGRSNRDRLLKEFAEHLNEGSLIFLSTWQFLDSHRQTRKIIDWSAVSLNQEDVESNDFLLTWKRGGYALRYVAYIDAAEITSLADSAGLQVVSQYRSDGREGDLNLYSVLGR